MNKVVVRFADGRILNGFTTDFLPAKDHFHVALNQAPPGSRPVDVQVKDLKALFFVKDFHGNPGYEERKDFDPTHPPGGRKIKVLFKDGETIVGTTQGYQPGRPGFFVTPADPGSNNERCYVVSAATQEISFI
jgi:uncharacterized protein DUF6982